MHYFITIEFINYIINWFYRAQLTLSIKIFEHR